MTAFSIHRCQCRPCQQDADHPERDYHRQLNWFMSQLNTAQRRWYAAIEASRRGGTGDRLVSQITGLGRPAIRRGHGEVKALAAGMPDERPPNRSGRPRTEKRYPEILQVLEGLLADEVAGDPMSNKKWVRRSSRELTRQLQAKGYQTNNHTVCRLLRDMGFSMKVNVKKRASTAYAPVRDAQFKYLASQKDVFLTAGLPVISVDAKKKELIGNFRAGGRTWRKTPIEVSEYTFASLAACVASPYGVYDLANNRGYVQVNTSVDSPERAVTAIRRWWHQAGCHAYPGATKLLILADGGGSNGCRCRAWKKQVQTQLCDGLRLTVTVCHYPPRCSKYNPIERRLFSHISMNWGGCL